MFWNKKKKEVEENDWTKKYKVLWNEGNAAAKEIRKQIYEVEAKIRVIELYPDTCPEKEVAIERMNEAKKKLAELCTKYHKAVVAIESYWCLYHHDIEVNWYPSQWKSSTKIVEEWYRSIHNLWMRA